MIDVVIAVVASVLASSGLWGLIQFLINRKDGTSKKLDDIINAVKDINEKVDKNSATLSRTHILRFDDELINEVHHSREYFQQTLDDIDTYERYCETHPNYKNSTCTLAIEHIKKVYSDLQNKGGFD